MPEGRPKTISAKRSAAIEQAEPDELEDLDRERPQTRGECEQAARPCPFVGCRHHLYLEVNPRTGSIQFTFPNLDVSEMKETCSLDVAEQDGVTLERVGNFLNLTRERIRQLEVKGLVQLRVNPRIERRHVTYTVTFDEE